jgi:DNA modification methylase
VVLLEHFPPYGVNYVGKTRDALTIENDGADGLQDLLTAAFTLAGDALEPGSPFYIAHPAGPLCLVFGAAVLSVGWKIHQTLMWLKDSMVLGHADYHYKHEPIFYGWTPGVGRSGRGNHDGSRWYGDNSQTSVFDIARPKRSEDHPTMKPPELVEACIRNSSPRDGIVLDLFLGSGTTMVAAHNLGRVCYGMEIDEGYAAVILERMSGMGITPTLEATP